MTKKKTSTQIRSEAMKKSWARRRNSPMREQARKRTNDLGDKISRRDLKSKPKGEPKFWILWMPSSNKPPRIRFGTLEKVRGVANFMVNKYHQPIYVMESVELHTLGNPEVIKYDGAPDKEPKAKPLPPETFQVSPPPPMQGQTWDQTQDEKLTRLYWEFRRHPEIFHILAKAMGRSELAIEYRLDTLGLRLREG